MHRSRVRSPNGVLPGRVLLGGYVRGTWTVRREGDAATLVVAPFGAPDATTRDAVVREGEAFVRSVADDATEHAVEVLAGEAPAVEAVGR